MSHVISLMVIFIAGLVVAATLADGDDDERH